MLCLSVRQPWAWLLVTGWKSIENRDWRTSVRGRVLIHASKTMTEADYQACILFIQGFSWCAELLPVLPRQDELKRGGIVGEATILDCVTAHSSDWFTGPYGFVLADARQLPFRPLRGIPGFFHECQPRHQAMRRDGWRNCLVCGVELHRYGPAIHAQAAGQRGAEGGTLVSAGDACRASRISQLAANPSERSTRVLSSV